jgi:4-hydroxybutyrate CoA-transferase
VTSSWKNKYGDKLVAPEKAIKAVKSGAKVVLANLCAEPHILPNLLFERAQELENVRLFHARPFGKFIDRYLEPGMEKHIRCATTFAGGIPQIVQLIKEGRADFYPVALSRIPWLFREGPYKPDVFLANVSPPDGRGYCSLGVSVDWAWAALETASLVIAEVNENMPRTGGDSMVHVSQLDFLVETSEPIYELPQPKITKVERAIGENVAALVEDGATIQIGYGGIAEATAPFLEDRKDLGMHTEMVPEGVMKLVEEGAMTCKKKSIHRGRIVCTFNAGTKRLYEWLNRNKMIEMKPVDYVNDSRVIAKNRKMTSINAALQVDLYGNIYSDMLGFEQYSGAGGQPDFVVGAFLCPSGKSITVLPSTARSGSVSRIVLHPALSGSDKAPMVATVARSFADFVVTEYGVASLRDKTTSERAEALIEIAHPDFKDELLRNARKMGLVT